MSSATDRDPLSSGVLRDLRSEGRGRSAAEVLREMGFAELAPPERPYLVVNMVATVDGRATVGGRTGPIGNEADRELFHHLRTTVDAVMVGAGTVNVERYGRLVRDPRLRELRAQRGLQPDPLACILSGRLDLDPDVPLLQDESSRVVVATGSDQTLDGCKAHVEYLRGEATHLQMAPIVAKLRRDHAVRSILCEGGPTLNSVLLREGLIDELFLSVAAKLAGGPDPLTIVSGPPLPAPVQLELVSCLESDGDLFLRYRVRGG